jgi:hypothetical protein
MQLGMVFKAWKHALRQAREVGEWVGRRRRMMMCDIVADWRRLCVAENNVKARVAEIMKNNAEAKVNRTHALLMYSRSFAAWRRVTNRTAAQRANLSSLANRHQHVILMDSFAAWAQHSVIASRAALLCNKRVRNPFQFAVRSHLTPDPQLEVLIA